MLWKGSRDWRDPPVCVPNNQSPPPFNTERNCSPFHGAAQTPVPTVLVGYAMAIVMPNVFCAPKFFSPTTPAGLPGPTRRPRDCFPSKAPLPPPEVFEGGSTLASSALNSPFWRMLIHANEFACHRSSERHAPALPPHQFVHVCPTVGLVGVPVAHEQPPTAGP